MLRPAPHNDPPKSPYREAPQDLEDPPEQVDEEGISTARAVAVATVFALLCSMVRICDPLFTREGCDLDETLALIFLAVSATIALRIGVVGSSRS